jgi:hypothetical protein
MIIIYFVELQLSIGFLYLIAHIECILIQIAIKFLILVEKLNLENHIHKSFHIRREGNQMEILL